MFNIFALSSLLSAHVHQTAALIDAIVTESFFFAKNGCFEFLNADVTLLLMPLYFLQSSVDPDDFALWNKVFPLLHGTGDSCVYWVEHPLGYRFPG